MRDFALIIRRGGEFVGARSEAGQSPLPVMDSEVGF